MATDTWIELPVEGSGSGGVTSLNGETGAITLVAGTGISITPSGTNITIANTEAGGTVTSVALADGSTVPLYSISGSPVTTSGTLTFTLNTQTANKVLASPTSGGAAQPTFRALVAADLPTGNLTDAGTDGIVITGGTGAVIGSGTSIAQHVADSTHNGYLASADFNTFSGKQSTITIGAFNNTSTANGLDLTSNVLTLHAADTTNPGAVSTGTQSFVGVKTFTSNVAISTASTTALTLASTGFVFDSTNFALGINNGTPSTAAFIDAINTSGATKRVLLTGYGTASLVGFRTRLARGTVGSPTAVQTGDILGFFNSEGYGTSQFPITGTGAITFTAGENFTNTSNLTYVTINSTATGAVTSVENLRVASTGNTIGPQSASTAIHQVNGGVNVTTRTITANLTIDTTTTDEVIFCNQSGAITVTLPAPTNGRRITIKDISGTAQTNNITVARHGSENIEGLAASKIIQGNFDGDTFVSDGTNWWMI